MESKENKKGGSGYLEYSSGGEKESVRVFFLCDWKDSTPLEHNRIEQDRIWLNIAKQ